MKNNEVNEEKESRKSKSKRLIKTWKKIVFDDSEQDEAI